MIFVDSSFLVSLYLDTDSNYSRAKTYWPNIKEEKVITEDVLKEILTVISQRKGRSAVITAYQEIASDYTILPVTPIRFQAGLALFLNPKLQKDVSLIDCITAAVCKEMGIKRILTFDPHFRLLGLTPRP